MILNRYEIFLKTAEIGNITKTAEILHYTQAGISHAIAALEKETGFSLLARSASGVTLTENGKRLLPYIQTLVNDGGGRPADGGGLPVRKALDLNFFQKRPVPRACLRHGHGQHWRAHGASRLCGGLVLRHGGGTL